MIQPFVDRFMAAQSDLRAVFAAGHPEDYKAVVAAVVRVIAGPDHHGAPDADRIHQIDDGNYKGTLVFVVAENGYQPSEYWYVKVSYGSCSGCDTLEGIRGYSGPAPTEGQIDGYMTLALHVVQGLKLMAEPDAGEPT